jgi:hypothetical protein
VLSKGGNCVYSDRPENINHFLSESNVSIPSHQIPIEAMLKYSCYNQENPTVDDIIEKTSSEEIISMKNLSKLL